MTFAVGVYEPVRTDEGLEVALFTVPVTHPAKVYPLGAPAVGSVTEFPASTVWLAIALTPEGTEKLTVYVVTGTSGSGSVGCVEPDEGAVVYTVAEDAPVVAFQRYTLELDELRSWNTLLEYPIYG